MVTVTTADGKKRTQTLGTADFVSENRRMECNVQLADIEVVHRSDHGLGGRRRPAAGR